LHSKNWNSQRTKADKARFSKIALGGYAKKGTKWRKKNLEHQRSKKDNPEWLSNLSNTITEKQNQPEYLEHMSKQRVEAMDKPVDESGITLREKLTEANRKSAANPIHHANRTAANRKLKNDPKWKEAHAKGVLKYSQAVITPYGEYSSMAKWEKQFGESMSGLLNGLPHLFYKVKEGPGEPTYERIYNTPYGRCAIDRFAYDVCKSNNEPNAVKMRNVAGWWIKMATLYPNEYYISFEQAKYWPIENDKLFGSDLIKKKPRIKQDKLEHMLEMWNNRLAKQKKMYKEIVT
jgi:hypothetical protein